MNVEWVDDGFVGSRGRGTSEVADSPVHPTPSPSLREGEAILLKVLGTGTGGRGTREGRRDENLKSPSVCLGGGLDKRGGTRSSPMTTH